MIDRIKKNEKRLDEIVESIDNLNSALDKFENQKENIKELNKYYESKTWIKDFDSYNNGKIKGVKAGVLSEDAVWNMNEAINESFYRMERMVEERSEYR